MKKFAILACLFGALACGGEAIEGEDSIETEVIGTVEQAVGFKSGTTDGYGVVNISGEPHRHARCPATETGVKCTVPQTKGPTYYIHNSLNANEQQYARIAIGLIDQQTNWTFTETTESTLATLTFNRIDNNCSGGNIQDLVCVNLSGQGNAYNESPSALPNSYTSHTKGIIHLDRAKLNLCTTCSDGEKNKRMSHGFQAAIVSWMGLGIGGADDSKSPARRFVRNPDDTGFLTAGEVCKLNGFLPAGQFGTASTIGLVSSTRCAD
jgi:hypothetical protein